MYINIFYIHSKGFTATEITALTIAKQNKYENQEEALATYMSDSMLAKFEDKGLIDYINKKRKSDSDFSVIRTTKKANTFLENCETPEVTEDSLKIFAWVKSIYEKEDKEIGNQKKCKMFIAQFSAESGIVRNHLAFLIQQFISDEKEMEFSQRMEYLFFKVSSVFSTKFDLYQSRLYQYYQKHQNYFDQKFQNINN